jgi:sialidase-1
MTSGLWPAAVPAAPLYEAGTEVFTNDRHPSGPYERDVHYRLPGLIVTSKGTLIASCIKKHGTGGDWARSDLVMRRSLDGGRTWQPEQSINPDINTTVFNGNLVEDRQVDALFAMYIEFPFHPNDPGRDGANWFRNVWVPRGGGFTLVKSTDDGRTWSTGRPITPTPNADGWHGAACFNNNHGVQLRYGRFNGRLVVNARAFKKGVYEDRAKGALVYSDDHGETWHIGGVPFPTRGAGVVGEVTLGETVDGHVYLNGRNQSDEGDNFHYKRRLYARSSDGGETFYEQGHHQELVTPRCNAGQCRLSTAGDGGRNVMLFTKPATGKDRSRLTCYLSYDEGRTWVRGRQIAEAGGYSDVAVLPDKTILALYEDDGLKLVRCNLEWLIAEGSGQ